MHVKKIQRLVEILPSFWKFRCFWTFQAELSWFGKRFKKKNHSTGYLSYLVPSFLSSLATADEDAVRQISIDNSRHILYLLTQRGTIEVWDLGENGTSMSRVASVSQAHIIQMATKVVGFVFVFFLEGWGSLRVAHVPSFQCLPEDFDKKLPRC